MTLREARQQAGLTQAQAAAHLGVSLRSYKTYETAPEKTGMMKYRYMLEQLEALGRVDETHGLLTLEDIRRVLGTVLADYPVTYAYLFGSYAKGRATEHSDVDLLVSGGVEGLQFYGLVEALKTGLRKEVDVLTPAQLVNNPQLMDEILREGVKVYG